MALFTLIMAVLSGRKATITEMEHIPPKPLPQPHETPVEPAAEPPPKKDLIREWALAIQEFEGWKPGSHAYRHNNPGNIKSVDGTFKTFATYEEGFAALVDYLTRACTGKHRAYRPTMTLKQFFATYAPDGNTIVSNYTAYVAKKIGVTPETVISTLV